MERATHPPIGLVHGYGFSGAGSNLWTRSMARALCRMGRDVHVVCQESRPEEFEFVTSAVTYEADGAARELFSRDGPYPGRCVVHRPELAVLPAYVRPRTRSSYVVSILDLDDASIEDYVRRNAAVLHRVAEDYRVAGFCVNHVVLSAVAAQRAKLRCGVPYAVLPHGSAIEYVVKHDERMRAMASDALSDANLVFVLNAEMEQRLEDVFGTVPELRARMRRLPVGVDTSQFWPAGRDERNDVVSDLVELTRDLPHGRMAVQKRNLRNRLRPEMSTTELRDALQAGTDYVSQSPDDDLADSLTSVDWNGSRVVLYVGRLTAAKGIPSVVLAFPEIAARYPDARLVVAGTGALREPMEALVWALSEGWEQLVRQIVELGAGLEQPAYDPDPFVHGLGFIKRLTSEGRWDEFVGRARHGLQPEKVVFTGFLDHEPLGRLYAIADVGVFPSVVREASPLVVPEAAASGTLPIGTDFGGMGDSLRTLGALLPAEARELMTVSYAAEHTVLEIAEAVSAALARPGAWVEELRRAAAEQYDWQSIGGRLASAIDEMRA